MSLDPDTCYRALSARDTRFDGVFFVGVTTTGVYCRPVCRARRPGADRCRYFTTPAAAEQEGFRPCLRCRPELAPGRAIVDATGRLAAAAAARIAAGALNGRGVDALAAELHVGERQLRRALAREFGVGPLELAQTHRLLLAKRLLTDSALPVTQVAFASGFRSIRRFNALFRERYRLNPTALRRTRAEAEAAEGTLALTLAYRPPLAWGALLAYLAGRATPGVEAVEGDRYLRTVALDGCRGWIAVEPARGADALRVRVSLGLAPVLMPLLARLKSLFDLDAEPEPIAAHLSADSALAPRVRREPGLRVPGCVDGFELAMRAVLGQQVSVRAATTLAGRIATAFGEPLETGHPALTRSPVSAEHMAAVEPEELAALGLTRARAATVVALARAVAEDGVRLEPGADVERTMERLRAIPGIGEWTAQYVAMRALHWPDAFPHGDLGLRKAWGGASAARLRADAERWRPWRAYAALYLWTFGAAPSAPSHTLEEAQ
ncbi:MAG: helix-turn-helix domain-containing protein [Gemmatimonadetes bacterium]|nr:helix-turn-helix domain-containing protein [Gemmatimonadota bacterium]